MKRAVVAGSIALLALSLSQASAVGPDVAAACAGRTDAAGVGSCTDTFVLEGEDTGRFVSLLGTYGNLITLGEAGTVQIVWTDAEANVIAELTCTGLGLAALDVASVLCSPSSEFAATYVVGVQTFTVTATSDGPNQDFHGQLTLSRDGELI